MENWEFGRGKPSLVLGVRKRVGSLWTGLLLGTGRTAHRRCSKKGGDGGPVGPR